MEMRISTYKGAILSLIAVTILLSFAPINLSLLGSSPDDKLVIATWNLQFYSQGKANEISPEYGNKTFNEFLAQVIQSQGIDILAMQEVSSSGGFPHLRQLVDLLGGFSVFDFTYSQSGGGQRLAFLYRKTAVDVLAIEELEEINLTGRLRGALVLKVKRRNNGIDLTIVNVHNDSGESSSDKANRRRQIELLANWVKDQLASQPEERDFLILGDFNELYDQGHDEDEGRLDLLEAMFEFFYPGPFTRISSCLCRQIDHIVVSKGPGGAIQELMRAPQALMPNELGFSGTLEHFKKEVSDHLPVIASFENVDLD